MAATRRGHQSKGICRRLAHPCQVSVVTPECGQLPPHGPLAAPSLPQPEQEGAGRFGIDCCRIVLSRMSNLRQVLLKLLEIASVSSQCALRVVPVECQVLEKLCDTHVLSSSQPRLEGPLSCSFKNALRTLRERSA